MATTLTGLAGPAELESTMDSPPVGPTVELGTTSLDPIIFPTVPPIVSGASSSKVAAGQSSAIATQNGSHGSHNGFIFLFHVADSQGAKKFTSFLDQELMYKILYVLM